MKPDMTTQQFRDSLERTMSEKDFQQWVLDLAKLHSWKAYHTFDSRHSVAGFPDVVLVKHRVIYAELKRMNGILTPAQKEWEMALRKAGAEFLVWRPSDRSNIERILGAAR